MLNFITLTKIFFLSGFNVNRKKQNQKSSKSLFIGSLVLFAIVSVMVSLSLINQLGKDGNYEIMLGILIALSFVLNLVLSIVQLQSIIFNAKDYEFLESLPISKTCIVASKLVSIYLINLAEDLALIIPASIVFVCFKGDITHAFIAILSQVFISVCPILISAVFGSVSALLSAKSKHSNFVNIFVSLILFAGFFAGYMFVIYGGANNVSGALDKIFFLNWMQRGINGEILYSLYYILFNLGLAIIVTLMISLLYTPVNAWLKSGGVHVDYDTVKDKCNSKDITQEKYLLKKEWEMVYRRPQYFINSILGCVFFLITALIFVFFPTLFYSGEGEVPESLPYIFLMIVPSMGILMNSITSSTAASISFEGRAGYENLVSYPVDPMAIIKAKLKIGIYIEVVCNLIVSLILSILFIIKGFNSPYIFIEIILFPQLAGLFTAVLGMITGLKWPKLDYENEAQVLKNSAAANLLILFVMLPSFILFGIHMVFTVFAMGGLLYLHYVDIAFTTIVFVVATIIFLHVLKSKGRRMFYNIINK